MRWICGRPFFALRAGRDGSGVPLADDTDEKEICEHVTERAGSSRRRSSPHRSAKKRLTVPDHDVKDVQSRHRGRCLYCRNPGSSTLSHDNSHPPCSGEPEAVAEEDERPSWCHPQIVEMVDGLELGSSSPIETALRQPSFDDQAMTGF